MTTNSGNMIVNETSNHYRIILKESIDNIATKLKPIIYKVDRSEKNAKINYENQCKVVKALYKLNKSVSVLNSNIQTLISQQVDLDNRIQNIEALNAEVQTLIIQHVDLDNRIHTIESSL